MRMVPIIMLFVPVMLTTANEISHLTRLLRRFLRELGQAASAAPAVAAIQEAAAFPSSSPPPLRRYNSRMPVALCRLRRRRVGKVLEPDTPLTP